jgi:hypothetical protein
MTSMSNSVYQLSLNFGQILALVKQLPESEKIRLSQALEKDLREQKLTSTPEKEKTVRDQGWPPDFFEKTWGSCADAPIIIDEAGVSKELDNGFDNMFAS